MIGTAIDRETAVQVFDENGRSLCSIPKRAQDRLMGYSGSSVTIRMGSYYCVYDSRGAKVSSHYDFSGSGLRDYDELAAQTRRECDEGLADLFRLIGWLLKHSKTIIPIVVAILAVSGSIQYFILGKSFEDCNLHLLLTAGKALCAFFKAFALLIWSLLEKLFAFLF